MRGRVASPGLLLWMSTMAGLQSLSSAAILMDVVGPQAAGGFQAVTAALSAGTAVWVGAQRHASVPAVEHVERHADPE